MSLGAGPKLSAPPFEVEPAEGIEGELRGRAESQAVPRTVWVTDLVDLRPAYWSRIARPELSVDRQRALSEGRRLHLDLLRHLAPAEHREVRVRRDGIAGAIDLFDTVPVEVKSTGHVPLAANLSDTRPSYVEQLAMYCALVDCPAGRLLLIGTSSDGPTTATAVNVAVPGTSGVLSAMHLRAEALREARSRASPAGLPRCRWANRGCEYQQSSICDCTGEEPPLDLGILSEVRSLTELPAESERALRLVQEAARSPPALVRSFRDLSYPRRAFFERTDPVPAEAAEPFRASSDLWGTISDLLEQGAPGEVERRFPACGEPAEGVLCFRGQPVLVKTTQARRRRSLPELAAAQPHYFRELGVRCASLGAAEGLLILGYDSARSWAERLAVLSVRFAPIDAWVAWSNERRSALALSLERSDPSLAPPCPGWMYDRCAYRSVCGCGSAARSDGGPQR